MVTITHQLICLYEPMPLNLDSFNLFCRYGPDSRSYARCIQLALGDPFLDAGLGHSQAFGNLRHC